MGSLHVRARMSVAIAAGLLVGFAAPSPTVTRDDDHAQHPLARRHDGVTRAASMTSLARPLAFEQNDGQHAGSVDYVARGLEYRFSFDRAGVQVAFHGRQRERFAIEFAGGAHHRAPVGESPLPGRVNYLIGNRSASWHTDVPTFARVRYERAWPGIDVAFYGDGHQLEYDVIVSPRADPHRAHLSLRDLDAVSIDEGGRLVARVGTHRVQFSRPMAYQEIDGHRVAVDASYVLAANDVSFNLGPYDRARSLVIDPVLEYSTLLGGASDDTITDLAEDAAGNVYVTGTTLSTVFPLAANGYRFTTPAAEGPVVQSVFVTKLNAAGAMVYSAYIGAVGASSGEAIAVDASGNAYVAGVTNAREFPTRNAFQPDFMGGRDDGGDAFVLKLSSAGNTLVYSTFLGGGSDDSAHGIAVTALGDAVVVGATSSDDFPLRAAAMPTFTGDANADAPVSTGFATRLGANGAPIYSTYLSGVNQLARDVKVDASGRAYIVGYVAGGGLRTTSNAAQPTRPGGTDGFLIALSAPGAWMYASYVGGPNYDDGKAVAVDSDGSAFVALDSFGGGFPTSSGAYRTTAPGSGDVVVAKFATSGARLWATYFGGPSFESVWAMDLDQWHRATIVGSTSGTIETTRDAFQMRSGGGTDAFVATFGFASLSYSSYVGGSGNDIPLAVAADITGRVTLAGLTTSKNFPLRHPVDATNVCGPDAATCSDGFITRFAVQTPGTLPENSEIIYAKDATVVRGAWRRVEDPTAAGGVRLEHPDAGAPKVAAPLANPADYFEVKAHVRGGFNGIYFDDLAYAVWIRAKAQNNSYTNDSVYVQFSNAMTGDSAEDVPIAPIGSSEALTITLEDCSNCGVDGWGWQDAAYGYKVVAAPIPLFLDTETTIRIQTREDGISIDQIALVPWSVGSGAPGYPKQDATIYPSGFVVTNDIVLNVGTPVAADVHGAWRAVQDATAADGWRLWHPDAGAPKISAPLAAPVHYFDLAFRAESETPYALYLRGKADGDSPYNDSVYVQITNTPWAPGTISALTVNLEACSGTGLSGWMWRSDNWCAPGPRILRFAKSGWQRLRVQTREDGMSIDQIVLSPRRYLTTPPPPGIVP